MLISTETGSPHAGMKPGNSAGVYRFSHDFIGHCSRSSVSSFARSNLSIAATRNTASTRVLEQFANFISGCRFLHSIDELLEFMETWVFAISFATCQSGNRSEYIHAKGVLLLHIASSGGHHPFFVIGSVH